MRKLFIHLLLPFILPLAASCGQGGRKVVAPKALMTLGDSVYDFGDIKPSGGEYKHTFTVYNQGSEPLVIEKVETTCHCTSADYTHEPIMPGKSGSITTTFDATGYPPSRFSKTVRIYNNGTGRHKELVVRGNVVPD